MIHIAKKGKLLGTFLMVAAMCVPSVKVQAAVDSYTVTFRPGNVGYFAISSSSEGDKQSMAQAVAQQVYGNYTYEVTKNGAIKVTVPANEAVPSAPNYIQSDEGYFVKDASVWGPAAGETVDRNMDFVVDYGKLIDGVEYTIKYVDSASGESIAPVYIGLANAGEKRTENAPKQIVISAGTVYQLASGETLEKVLDADSTKNVFTFSYKMATRETVEQEIINYVDGDTITSTETNTSTIDNGTTTIPTNTPAAQEQGGGAGGNAEGENGDNTTIIDDEQVPLASSDSEEANTDTMVDIADEDVPLAGLEQEHKATMLTVVAGVFAASAVAAAILWLCFKRKKTAEK